MSGQIQDSNSNSIAEETTRELLNELSLPYSKPSNPIVLMFGGLQGSGKTTLLDNIKQEYELVVISGDVIRQRLFDRGYQFSEKFHKVVEIVNEKLIRSVLKRGYSIAIDIHSDAKRLDLVRQALNEFRQYRLVSVYLKTSPQVLRKRVGGRKGIEGVYRGKLNELEYAIEKHGDIDEFIYQYTIDTDKNSPREVSDLVRNMLKKII